MNESLDTEKLSNWMQQQVQKAKPASNKQTYYFAVGIDYCLKEGIVTSTFLYIDMDELKHILRTYYMFKDLQNIQFFEIEYEKMP